MQKWSKYLHRVNQYVPKILKVSYMKLWIEGHLRAALGKTADSAYFHLLWLNWLCCLARSSLVLKSRISCKIYRVSCHSLQECDSHNMWITIFTIQRPENSDGTPCIWNPYPFNMFRSPWSFLKFYLQISQHTVYFE